MEYHPGKKRMKSCHVRIWKELEGIILSEVTQREGQTPHNLKYTWNLKKKKIYVIVLENRLLLSEAVGGWGEIHECEILKRELEECFNLGNSSVMPHITRSSQLTQ